VHVRIGVILGFSAVAILAVLAVLYVDRLDIAAAHAPTWSAAPLPPAWPLVPAEFPEQADGALDEPVALEVKAENASRAELHAVAALAHASGLSADSVLVAAALGNAEIAVREEAIHALAERGACVAIPTLQQTLQDSSPRVQDATIFALRDIGGDEAVQSLGSALDLADPSLRLHAVDALGQMSQPAVALHLERALYDESDLVREAAAQWLAELPDARQ
jgi:HEAT repeat protein